MNNNYLDYVPGVYFIHVTPLSESKFSKVCSSQCQLADGCHQST